MSDATAKQFNNRVSYVSRTYLGKPNKKDGSEKFTTSSGKRFTGSKIIMLGLICTEAVMFGSLNKMPYDSFMSEINAARGTICRNLKELGEDDIIEHPAQSKYKIKADFSHKNNIPVYHFLLTEPIELDGGIKKRLSYNAVLYLCEMINFYLMPLEERNYQKWYIGGFHRAAKAINVPDSTACGVIDELIDTKAIYSKELSKDSAGNDMVKPGKGKHCKILTAYEVNSEILSRCRKIQKEMQELKEVKVLYTYGKVPEPKKSTARPAPATHNQKHDKYALAEQKFQKLEVTFASDETYKNIKQRYVQLKSIWLDKFIKENDLDRADELEDEMNDVLHELKTYILSRGSPPEDIPADIGKYIK